MKISKRKTKIHHLLVFIVFLFFSIQTNNSNDYINLVNGATTTERVVETLYTQQWLSDPGFITSLDSPWIPVIVGEETDFETNFDQNQANYIINGDQGSFSAVNGTPVSYISNPSIGWKEYIVPNSLTPYNPDHNDPDYGIDSLGCYVSHYWNEGSAQYNNTPSMKWKRNITMPVNMSQYEITSANVSVVVNGKVHDDHLGGLEVPGDPQGTGFNQGGIYDSATFYISISDREGLMPAIELARYKTVYLGQDNGSGLYNYLTNTFLTQSFTEAVLISVLTSIFENNAYNFTITLGIEIYCEDNLSGGDQDIWDELRINDVNLDFTYKKKIKQGSSISWKQVGNKINNGTGDVRIENASLNFMYKIDQAWPSSSSPNSEIRIYINDNLHTESIKLDSATDEYQYAKSSDGYDITSLILLNTNITFTLQTFLADNFELDEDITISVDNVSLSITYTVIEILTEDVPDMSLQQLIGLLILFSVILGPLLYVIIKQNILDPRKQRLIDALTLKTQVFEDVRNIRGIMAIHKKSGLLLYKEETESILEGNESLISAFLQAIITFSSNISDETTSKTLEFNFEDFNILAADGSAVRVAVVLKEKPSDQLIHSAGFFVDAFESRYGDKLINWRGGNTDIFEETEEIVESIFHLSLLDDYTFSETVNLRILEKELGSAGERMIKISKDVFYAKRFFVLDDIISKVPPEDQLMAKSIILDLLHYQLLIPYDEDTMEITIQNESLSADQSLGKTAQWMKTIEKSRTINIPEPDEKFIEKKKPIKKPKKSSKESVKKLEEIEKSIKKPEKAIKIEKQEIFDEIDKPKKIEKSKDKKEKEKKIKIEEEPKKLTKKERKIAEKERKEREIQQKKEEKQRLIEEEKQRKIDKKQRKIDEKKGKKKKN
ncbi:MAG: DUF1682 domain-containing protein [archaeon]|nr:DUF1682 domain-containing protein [archaeon]